MYHGMWKKLMISMLCICLCCTGMATCLAEGTESADETTIKASESSDARDAKNEDQALSPADEAKALLDQGEYEAGISILEEAAAKGDPEAQFVLGNCYYAGTGVEQNYEEAFKYCLQAAEKGVPVAMFAVGDCYYLGNGVKKDPDAAAEWMRKALAAGYEPDESDQAHLKEVLGEKPEVQQ